MAKKAGLGGWIIGLVAIFVVLFILGNLFSQVKSALFGVAPTFGDEKAPEIISKPRTTQEADQYFNNLVSKIKNPGPGEGCWVEVGKFKNSKYSEIVLYSDKIEIRKISTRGLSPPEKTAAIEGFRPCSIKGEKVKRFLFCLTNRIGCTDAYEEEKSISITQDSNIAEFLFKFDKGHICIVPVSFYFGGCTAGGELNSECLSEIKKVYPDCSRLASPKLQFDECGAINYCYRQAIFGNAKPELGCATGRPTAFFKTREDCLNGAKCIKESASGFMSNSADDCYEETGIWVWPKR